MQTPRFVLLIGLCAFSLGPVFGQTDDDLAIIKKVQVAMADAPFSRVTTVVTDRNSKAETERMVVEREKPDKVHFTTVKGGEAGTEMISDGQRSLMRDGPDEPWKKSPINVSALMNAGMSNLAADALKEEHGHLKLIGPDEVNGISAQVYELSTDEGKSKIWLATDNSRPLKAERDYEGPGAIPKLKKTAKGQFDIAALRDQLKAAQSKKQLHSVTSFEYDPSIKVTMPQQ